MFDIIFPTKNCSATDIIEEIYLFNVVELVRVLVQRLVTEMQGRMSTGMHMAKLQSLSTPATISLAFCITKADRSRGNSYFMQQIVTLTSNGYDSAHAK